MSSIAISKLYFANNIILLGKLKTHLEANFESKFNSSMLFSALASDYLMFVEMNSFNLFDFFSSTASFELKRSDGPSSSDLTDAAILQSYLKEEITTYNFLYFSLSLMILLQACTFYLNRLCADDTIAALSSVSLEEIYQFFKNNNSINYYEGFSHARYFYFPMNASHMFNITNRVLEKYPTLKEFTDNMESYEH